MSCGYLYEIRRKSQEFEESSEKTQPLRANLRTFSEEEEDDIWEVPEESFDNAYQTIIENEEDSDGILDTDFTADETDKKLKLSGNSSNVLQNVEIFSAQRLRLSLSAEQISLKSQQQQWENPHKSATQQREIINKSINTEADVVTKPLAVNSDSSSAASDTTTAIGTCHNGANSNAVIWKTVKINKKCEQNENTTPTTTTCPSKYPSIYLALNSRKKSQPENEIIQNMTDIQVNDDPTVIRKQRKTIKPPAEKQKVQSNFRKFSLESFSVKRPLRMDGQTLVQAECCFSPEAIVDNILSNASSTSVQSSSLSSSILTDDSEEPKADGSNNSFNICKKVFVATDTAKNPTFEQKLSNESKTPINLGFPIEKQRKPVIRVTHPSSSSSSTINNLALSVTSSESYETASAISRHPSLPTSDALVIHATTPTDQPHYSADLLCQICGDIFKDPRCLNCLHTFCLQCIVDENIKRDACNPFWSLVPNNNGSSSGQRQQKVIQIEENLKAFIATSTLPELKADNTTSDLLSSMAAQQKPRTSFSFKLKRSSDNSPTKTKSDINRPTTDITTSLNHVQHQQTIMTRKIICKICQFTTEVPTGGLRQLPQNLLIQRKIDALHFKISDAGSYCSLCYEQTDATHHCTTCTLNLCTLCKESHARQKTTATHNIKQIVELEAEHCASAYIGKYKPKCNLHQGFDVKSFCINCLQVACTDCLILHHKGHKHEAIAKASQCYARLLRDSTEQSRSVCKSTENSLQMLNEFSDTINRKCDELQADVEDFMRRYLEAVEAHKMNLLQQINRARETKMTIIAEKQMELEKRSMEAMTATTFSDELTDIATGVEILSFVKILLKRFEHCQQFQITVDPKITDVPNFLPKIQAPPGKDYNDIPVFGIITTQTVEPSQCTLQWDGFSQLRLHKKVELTLISRDADGSPINHGGLKIQSHVKYKEVNSKCLRMEVTDNSDGTYNISFTPDTEGTIILMITINYKHIKGSPFSFLARTVRPHTGIYHCCTFCSSKGNKFTTCSCDGHMPGYSGCGHGHTGHPGHRHWSCCGDVLRNSECHFSNRSLNPK